ncbi:MAG: hypothetical protein AAF939_19760, partial [Planctomycetota bacterium]
MPKTPKFDPVDLTEQFQEALSRFCERISKDRNILAAVMVGGLEESLIWNKDVLSLWIIEIDGVTKRLESDGNDEEISRCFVENGINVHVELIPRSRFKKMVEGTSRTAFSFNFFAKRSLVYCNDPSIEKWFDTANSLAEKDQDQETLVATTWLISATRYVRKRLERKNDLELGKEGLLSAAHSLACLEVIRHGEVFEHSAIYRALELNPKLFKTVYIDLITGKKTKTQLIKILGKHESFLNQNAVDFLQPILKYLKKENR